MITVSEIIMKIAITLNKNIECEYICKQIQKLVNKFQQSSQDISGAVLVLDIIQTIDGGDHHIPKLEYHPDCTT
jgi:hypothetical protein